MWCLEVLIALNDKAQDEHDRSEAAKKVTDEIHG